MPKAAGKQVAHLLPVSIVWQVYNVRLVAEVFESLADTHWPLNKKYPF